MLRSTAGFVAVAALAACAALAPKPLPPRVALESVRVTRLAVADTRATLGLAVQNPNDYDLAVEALDLAVAVEGEPFVAGRLARPVRLPARGEARADIDARATLGAVAAVADRLARGAAVRYEATGTLVLEGGLALPFRRSGELPAFDPGRTK